MEHESRTAKSLRNSRVAIIFYCANLVLTFFSRQAFIRHLGAEVLGLNTTAVNLLGFLNLAELGIGAAVSFALYGPLARDERRSVAEIIAVEGWLYRRIAWIVAAGGVVLACFFPLIFAKSELPLWYAWATFGVLLAGSLAGYFFNYRQIIFTADQRDYLLTRINMGVVLAKKGLQIAAIVLLPNGYVWWLGIELAGAAATVAGIEWLLRRHYPWLRADARQGGALRRKHPQIVAKTKQLFFHKIGSFVLSQTSPLVVYAFTSLTVVAVYGNYLFITAGVTLLLAALLGGAAAGVGNLVATADKTKIREFFGEMFSLRFWAAGVSCAAMWWLADGFVELWVGREFVIDRVSLALLTATLYVGITRGAVDTFIGASGLYDDIWAPVAEAALNLGASIALGYFWGLPGVLAGVLVSLVVVIKIWKPWFFYRRSLDAPIGSYVKLYARHLAAGVAAAAIFTPLARLVRLDAGASWVNLLTWGAIVTIGFGTLLAAALYLAAPSMRALTHRFAEILKTK